MNIAWTYQYIPMLSSQIIDQPKQIATFSLALSPSFPYPLAFDVLINSRSETLVTRLQQSGRLIDKRSSPKSPADGSLQSLNPFHATEARVGPMR
jgi:hypothetical protein